MGRKPRDSKLPSRRIAVALQHIGVLVFFGVFILQQFFSFSEGTLIYYYILAAATLGGGVLLRRHYDKD